MLVWYKVDLIIIISLKINLSLSWYIWKKNCWVGVKHQSLTQYLFGVIFIGCHLFSPLGFHLQYYQMDGTIIPVTWLPIDHFTFLKLFFFYSFLDELFSFKSGKMVPFQAISMKLHIFFPKSIQNFNVHKMFLK